MTKELLHTIFEYKDGNLIWKVNPKTGNKRIGHIAGTVNGNGYKQVIVLGKIKLYHRVVFLYHYGYLPQYIDHINRNRLDNRIENLREATARENQANRKIGKNNTSGYTGVSWDKVNKKWEATTRNDNKKINLGRYDTPVLARAAYVNWHEQNFKGFING